MYTFPTFSVCRVSKSRPAVMKQKCYLHSKALNPLGMFFVMLTFRSCIHVIPLETVEDGHTGDICCLFAVDA